MRSHHAPTLFLLRRFSFRDSGARGKQRIWVYERGLDPRSTRDFKSESAEHGYFSGASNGASEQETDQRLDRDYEAPFNSIVGSMDLNLHIFESKEIRQICARYVAHIFQRCQARRVGAECLVDDMSERYRRVADNPKLLLAYAAKLSCLARRPIPLEDLRSAIHEQLSALETNEARQTRFADDLDRSTRVLAEELEHMEWSIAMTSRTNEFFISDTPVVSLAFEPSTGVKFGVGIRYLGSQWYLPISPVCAIRIANTNRNNRATTFDLSALINHAQVLTMYRRLYGHIRSEHLNSMVQESGGAFRFHEHVFKGSFAHPGGRELDEVLALA